MPVRPMQHKGRQETAIIRRAGAGFDQQPQGRGFGHGMNRQQRTQAHPGRAQGMQQTTYVPGRKNAEKMPVMPQERPSRQTEIRQKRGGGFRRAPPQGPLPERMRGGSTASGRPEGRIGQHGIKVPQTARPQDRPVPQIAADKGTTAVKTQSLRVVPGRATKMFLDLKPEQARGRPRQGRVQPQAEERRPATAAQFGHGPPRDARPPGSPGRKEEGIRAETVGVRRLFQTARKGGAGRRDGRIVHHRVFQLPAPSPFAVRRP